MNKSFVKIILRIIVVSVMLIAIIITGIVIYKKLTTCTFSVKYKNGLTTNIRMYREAGMSYLELSRINNEEYEWPFTKETEPHGGMDIYDDTRFIILTLENIRQIDTSEAFDDKKYFNSYQLHKTNSKILKHMEAVRQLKKEKDKCIDWH